ncbi:MAG: SH3 domain-containing protein [Candidatus Saelkia tenebricola]|nr:SH3 domain-containing protein [Candidatus Saelkia tenebricola]
MGKLKILLILTLVFTVQYRAMSFDGLIVDMDILYLRAGPNQNFEVLKKLKKGEILKKVSEKYGWTEVELSTDVSLYVSDDYVSLKDSIGIIDSDRVNVRVCPTLKATVIGQMSKGDTVSIVGVHPGWVEIVSPKGFTGWAKTEYLGSYLADIEETVSKSVPVVMENAQKEDLIEEITQVITPVVEPKEVSSDDVFRGTVEDVGRLFYRKSKYKLITPEGKKYYLIGFDSGITVYLGQEVTIEGELIAKDVIEIIRIF